MTLLRGRLERETVAPGIHKPVIVILDADSRRIGFREKGGRKTWYLSFATAFALAIRAGEEEK